MNKKNAVFAIAAAVVLCAEAEISVATNDTVVTISVPAGTEAFPHAMLAPDVTRLVKTGIGIIEYYPGEASTHQGGTLVSAGQFRIKRADALGGGDVQLGNTGSNTDANILAVDGDVTIPNKIVFAAPGCYAAAFPASADARLTLQSVAAEPGVPVRLGRVGAGAPSRVRLSLVDEDSEAVGQYVLSGAVDLEIDGGTIKASADAESPFFTSRTSDDPVVNVGESGFVFDAAFGADVEFGQPLAFKVATTATVLETAEPANNSFESGATGWSFSDNGHGEASGVKKNSEAFSTGTDSGVVYAYTTTNGTQYAMVRRNATLTPTAGVVLPRAGLWRVAGEVGCRPLGAYSLNLTTSIVVDGETIGEIPAITTHGEKHTFRQFETPPLQLDAGSHTFAIAVGDSENGNGSLNFDLLRFERVEVEESIGPFGKTGRGRLAIDGFAHSGAVSVTDGELALENPTLDGATVTVASGAALALASASGTDGAAVSVASGGTLALAAVGGNLIANGGFEGDGEHLNIWATSPAQWTLENTQETSLNERKSGIQGNGGNVTESGPYTPDGVETVYMREYARLSQTVAVAESGIYRISWLQACRSGFSSRQIPLTVLVDGEAAAAPAEFSEDYGFVRLYADVELAAGEHVVAFETGAPQTASGTGAMVFVDAVEMRKCGEFGGLDGCTLALEPGATIRLDCTDTVHVGAVTVGGATVIGGRATLAGKGVAVSGPGDIFCGTPVGTVLMFR